MTRQASKNAADPRSRGTEAEVAELRQENEQLREAVASHADVDRALGVLVALAHVPPGRAWEMLRDISQHTNVKLRVVALLIIQWGHTGVLPARIEDELRRQVRACRGHRAPGARRGPGRGGCRAR
ncbi:ANTAR domain-containing protein [Streptomyces sp. SGAir0957]